MRGSRSAPAPVVVDVWTVVGPDAVTPGWHAVLDPAERRRAAALSPPASSRFVVGRALLRGVLAERHGCRPDAVSLEATCLRCGGPHGPVRVRGARDEPDRGGATSPVHVSVTRTGPVVSVAVTTGGPVGIDVESPDRVRAAPLADVVLSAGERDRLRRRLGRHARERDLARAWVRKEAALKALGTGLTTDPSSVTIGAPPPRVRGVDGVTAGGVDGVTAGEVAVADLRLGRGRVGAVAIVRPGVRRLVVRRYDGAPVLDGLRS